MHLPPALQGHPGSLLLQLGRRLLLLQVPLPSLGSLGLEACPSLSLALSRCLWLSLAEGNLQAVLFEGCCRNSRAAFPLQCAHVSACVGEVLFILHFLWHLVKHPPVSYP